MYNRSGFSKMLVGGAMCCPLFVGCSGGFGTLSNVAAASCPANVLSVQSIQSANFGLEGELESQAKASLEAGALVFEIASDLEAEVLAACTNIAKDLGVSAAEMKPEKDVPGAKVKATCGAAARAIADVRASVEGNFELKVEPPVCYADANVMADCAGKCDASIDPGSAEVECEGGKLSGKCSGKCEGTCTVDATAKCSGSCSGECSGTCSGEMRGTCGGACEGKCDGKNVSGKCNGVCDGKCDAKIEGSCAAKCDGRCDASCEMDASGQCEGTCTGSCSVDFEAPKCTGEVKPPEMSAECEAKCEAEVTAKVECQPARVRIVSSVEAQTEQVTALFATLEANLPALIKVAGTMKARAETVVASSKASLEGMKATLQSAGSDAIAVVGCFTSSLEAQAKASATISVSVEASASVSGKASGSM